jgi:hypothetical protein
MEPERELEPAPGPERAAPLPFLEDELWAYTAAFLDDARALGRLARVWRADSQRSRSRQPPWLSPGARSTCEIGCQPSSWTVATPAD